ncbi:MAG: AmmeMemoRadiSam system protein B [Gammaproteobacteria bacterium AqS3]|nr:AmmeMemoRadiSam system protein B [Gammaproteobacteria bacterium AqS3]
MQQSDSLRPPELAGAWYPALTRTLRADLSGYLQAPRKLPKAPKALIAPHAGYVYSGAMAGSAYAELAPVRATVRRVVLLGPAHRVGFDGIASHSAQAFLTPLGSVPLAHQALGALADLGYVGYLDEAHVGENSLELHIPFLQAALDDFELLPLLVGRADPGQVAAVLDRLWAGDETLFVISSDLSHYHDYDTARRLDGATTRAIEGMSIDLTGEQACGCMPINGLMYTARRRKMTVQTLGCCNSGDTAGGRDQVVGYGSYALY